MVAVVWSDLGWAALLAAAGIATVIIGRRARRGWDRGQRDDRHWAVLSLSVFVARAVLVLALAFLISAIID